jgi:hypothetical protein
VPVRTLLASLTLALHPEGAYMRAVALWRRDNTARSASTTAPQQLHVVQDEQGIKSIVAVLNRNAVHVPCSMESSGRTAAAAQSLPCGRRPAPAAQGRRPPSAQRCTTMSLAFMSSPCKASETRY